jgi:hypothetical protein
VTWAAFIDCAVAVVIFAIADLFGRPDLTDTRSPYLLIVAEPCTCATFSNTFCIGRSRIACILLASGTATCDTIIEIAIAILIFATASFFLRQDLSFTYSPFTVLIACASARFAYTYICCTFWATVTRLDAGGFAKLVTIGIRAVDFAVAIIIFAVVAQCKAIFCNGLANDAVAPVWFAQFGWMADLEMTVLAGARAWQTRITWPCLSLCMTCFAEKGYAHAVYTIAFVIMVVTFAFARTKELVWVDGDHVTQITFAWWRWATTAQ